MCENNAKMLKRIKSSEQRTGPSSVPRIAGDLAVMVTSQFGHRFRSIVARFVLMDNRAKIRI